MDIFKILSKYPVLSHIEMLEMIQAAQSQKPCSTRIRNKLINHNLRLVISIAKKYQYQGIGLEDLIQDGIIGLSQAIEKFDVSRGTHFSTYATYWIRQSIKRSIHESSTAIRLPVHAHEKIYKIKMGVKTFCQKYGRYPSLSELSERLGMPEEKVLHYSKSYSISSNVLSLNSMNSADAEYLEMCGEIDSNYQKTEMDDFLKSAISNLSLDEKEFIRLYFVEETGVRQACHRIGMKNAGKVKKRIICKMRKSV